MCSLNVDYRQKWTQFMYYKPPVVACAKALSVAASCNILLIMVVTEQW